ncbi:MAG: PP2C family serine/threonine-protein phosphatase, partial [Spirochaetota bacterium]
LEDRAGNRSTPVSLTYFRDRTPPEAPVLLYPALDGTGALASNSFELSWLPSMADDLRGYTWARLGPLDPNKVPASLKRGAVTTVPGVSILEAALIDYYGLPRPPPEVLGSVPSLAESNIDNGYWLYSVAAIDRTGNVSEVSTLLFRADKQVPFTLVYDIRQTADLIGRRSLAISGRGFTDEGVMARVILSRSRNQPYDVVKESATGGFHVASNGLIDGIAIEDLQAGSYWLGLLHPTRGLYWAPNKVVFDLSGTLKYGVEFGWKPDWSLGSVPRSRFSIYDVILLVAALFCGLGIVLSLGQATSVWRDGIAVNLQVLALVNGGPMPSAVREKELKKRRRQGLGLQFKFTFFIAILVLFVVLLVALFLGISMVQNQSAALARGLGDSAKVLLESAAQSGRFFLDKEGAVTQLGFLPPQATAMPSAEYITITGNSADARVVGRDVVYASNDPAISRKIDSSRLELGVSQMRADAEELAAKVGGMATELEAKAREAIAGDLARKVELARQKDALTRGAGGDADRQRINQTLDEIDRGIRDRLRAISDEAVGSIPGFDPTVLVPTATSYLFFKPVLEYRPADQILYRGMVRLSANTKLIVADVAERTRLLVISTAEVAALVLLVGIIGAFFLSRSIVRPIGRVIRAIEEMRKTEDKADLEGFSVEVRTRDELSILAGAANALAAELVDAAKQSKALIEGADIQNHFIPLTVDDHGRTLTTSTKSGTNYELYGYYKGAKRVSGDYWNFEPLGTDGRFYYFIKCDVSGKDVSAAFIMVQVGTMVINHFNQWDRLSKTPDFELAKLTYRINDFLVERKYRGKFAAFTLGVISMTDGAVTICHAGDNMFRAWRSATGRSMAEPFQPDIDKSSPATGMIDSELMELKKTGFYTYRRKIGKGDILLLFSDGMEDPIHRFRDADGNTRACTELEGAEDVHLHHKVGSGDEHLGPDRLDAFIEAWDRHEVHTVHHDHETERDLVMSFDFTKAADDLSDRVIAYIAVGRVFSIHDWNAGDDEEILVDKRVDAFLAKYFDQYSLVFRKREAIMIKTGRKNAEGVDELVEDPNYIRFRGIKEDEQYDDLSIVAIRRK